MLECLKCGYTSIGGFIRNLEGKLVCPICKSEKLEDDEYRGNPFA